MTIETLRELDANKQVDKLIQVGSLIIIDLVEKMRFNITRFRDTKKNIYIKRYNEFEAQLKEVNSLINKYHD